MDALLRPDTLYPPSKGEVEKMQANLERLGRANEDLFTRNDQLVLRIETIRTAFNHKVEDLAKAYTLIKQGDVKDGLYELERVLSEVDSGWRCLA